MDTNLELEFLKWEVTTIVKKYLCFLRNRLRILNYDKSHFIKKPFRLNIVDIIPIKK